jgi:hypothetical protein
LPVNCVTVLFPADADVHAAIVQSCSNAVFPITEQRRGRSGLAEPQAQLS